MIGIVSSSLNPQSKSSLLASYVNEQFQALGQNVQSIDLRDHRLELCDGGAAYEQPSLQPLNQKLSKITSFVLATPIYNYDVNAALKNFIELCGNSLVGKPVGLLAAAGGELSFMAPLTFLNSLMLDFRCIVLPRYVYASEAAFDGEKVVSASVGKRLQEFCRDFVFLSSALEVATRAQAGMQQQAAEA